MGNVNSSVEALAKVQFTQLRKGRVFNAKRVIVIDDRGTAVIELSNGTYTVVGRHHGPNGNWHVLFYGLDNFTQAVLHGLVRIGVLKSKEVKEHIATAEERKKAYYKRNDMRHLRELCEEHGIPVPAEAME